MRRAQLYGLAFAAAAAGIVVGRASAHGADLRGMEPSLISLLRFMAVLKSAAAVTMLGLTHWRLTRPAGGTLAVAYMAAVASVSASPGLIWSLSNVALGAVLFHAGLIVFVILAWRDDAVELRLRGSSGG